MRCVGSGLPANSPCLAFRVHSQDTDSCQRLHTAFPPVLVGRTGEHRPGEGHSPNWSWPRLKLRRKSQPCLGSAWSAYGLGRKVLSKRGAGHGHQRVIPCHSFGVSHGYEGPALPCARWRTRWTTVDVRRMETIPLRKSPNRIAPFPPWATIHYSNSRFTEDGAAKFKNTGQTLV